MSINFRRPQRKSFDDSWSTCCWCDSGGTYRRWPKHMLIKRDGKEYCHAHYKFCFQYADMADAPIEVPREEKLDQEDDLNFTIDLVIPADDNLLVERLEQDTGGLVVVPVKRSQRLELVRVLRTGKECTKYKKGDVLIKASWSGSELDFIGFGEDWDRYRFISEGQVEGKIDEETPDGD